MLSVRPTGAALGAEVEGVDLSRPLTDDTFAALHQAWLDHLVLLFRGQTVTDDDLVSFSRRFGELDPAPASATDYAGAQAASRSEVWIISNVKVDGKPIGALGDKEADWHTDMSYVADPPIASVLYALEVPTSGGDTSFANMYRACETLPDTLRRRISGRIANHDSSTTSVGETRLGAQTVVDVRAAPGAHHKMLRRHPETGGEVLYLGRRRNAYVPGLDLEESEALLDALWAHCTDPAFAWTHRWQPGDLLIWDNRCTIHRRDGFDPASRRVMHRTQIRARS